MAALKWSLFMVTLLLSLAICSAHRVKPAQIVSGPITVPFGPTPSGRVPVPSGPITSEPVKVWPVPPGPVPVQAGPITSEPGKVWPVPPGPVPVPAMEAETLTQPPADAPVPSMTGGVADNEIGTNCCGGGCGGGGGGNPCPGYGCGGCTPAVPKNPYYCQPAANCVGSPGYGSGAGFTIYLDDHFPPSSSDEQH